MEEQPRPLAEEQEYPKGPAWTVGADREHTGPSGMGPGQDQPGFGQEVDEEDAVGVTGGFTADASTEERN